MKAVVFDIDGTIYDKSYGIDETLKEYIRNLIDIGVLVILATGRRYENTIPILESLNVKCNIILVTGDGQYIYDLIANKIETSNYIGTELIDVLISDKKIKIKCLYTSNADYYILNLVNLYKYFKSKFIGFITGKKDRNKLLINKKKTRKLNKVEKIVINKLPDIYLPTCNTRIFPKTIEITDKNVDKLYSVKKILSQYNISKDKVIVFGNDENDKLILRYFRNSYQVISKKNGLEKFACFELQNSYEISGILSQFFRFEMKGKFYE